MVEDLRREILDVISIDLHPMYVARRLLNYSKITHAEYKSVKQHNSNERKASVLLDLLEKNDSRFLALRWILKENGFSSLDLRIQQYVEDKSSTLHSSLQTEKPENAEVTVLIDSPEFCRSRENCADRSFSGTPKQQRQQKPSAMKICIFLHRRLLIVLSTLTVVGIVTLVVVTVRLVIDSRLRTIKKQTQAHGTVPTTTFVLLTEALILHSVVIPDNNVAVTVQLSQDNLMFATATDRLYQMQIHQNGTLFNLSLLAHLPFPVQDFTIDIDANKLYVFDAVRSVLHTYDLHINHSIIDSTTNHNSTGFENDHAYKNEYHKHNNGRAMVTDSHGNLLICGLYSGLKNTGRVKVMQIEFCNRPLVISDGDKLFYNYRTTYSSAIHAGFVAHYGNTMRLQNVHQVAVVSPVSAISVGKRSELLVATDNIISYYNDMGKVVRQLFSLQWRNCTISDFAVNTHTNTMFVLCQNIIYAVQYPD